MKNIFSIEQQNAAITFSQPFIFIFIVCIAIQFDLSAQRKFTSGYIVTIQGDTLNGLIKDKDWIRSPKEIDFRETGMPSQSYLASDVSMFRIDFNINLQKQKNKNT